MLILATCDKIVCGIFVVAGYKRVNHLYLANSEYPDEMLHNAAFIKVYTIS